MTLSIFHQEPSYLIEQDYYHILEQCYLANCSDITLQTGARVIANKDGLAMSLTKRTLTYNEVENVANLLYGSNAVAKVLSGSDLDFSYTLLMKQRQRVRFRVNITACHSANASGLQLSLRILPACPPPLNKLSVTDDLYDLSLVHDGIVIVCGATGSGKSTLLSSMLQHRLSRNLYGEKLITMESPIEYLYFVDEEMPVPASVSQSELPRQLPNYAYAVRNAMRRTPTAIMVGESRDQDTFSAVIEAALTGHAVYTTLHSKSVAEAFQRGLMLFPKEHQRTIKYDLLCTLKAIIWQNLIPSQKGGRVALREYLLFSDDKVKTLLETPEHQFAQVINEMMRQDKTNIDEHLKQLYQQDHLLSPNLSKHSIH
ncbi:type IV pilus twitching motility protein PilT [Fangia hongkongensis]|uniref:type IV pilus twitching motility protein PilT n=1 Tax=Fangia hongkongensis TaxID=270495 RepID=UPI000371F5CC|nr:ATPase, T2SS/T4P/T4SS family [Fangia hongkongensis]MBK2124621.1 Flp pilus assembly complex ATPase component TadA [Fangia hongkongensis]